jgi:hypothetical protein
MTRRKEIAAAFRAARDYLSETRHETTTRSEFICWALGNANEDDKISFTTASAARAVISERLCGHATLSDWIKFRHPALLTEMMTDFSTSEGQKMQATRLAWLNSLIEEFSQPA